MTSGSTRLHISPFTPALLEAVLNPSLRSAAANISFHTLETFPENNYGYVNLPTMESEKLKKKLNGSILKGKKIKVEEAKQKKRHRDEDGANSRSEEVSGTAELKKSSKKRKTGSDVLTGHELPPDRHVKRGWTEPTKRERTAHKSKTKEKKSNSQRSKYTENPECVFRTNPPANPVEVEKEGKKKSGSKKKEDVVVVHEFAKTVKHPTFLRPDGNAEETTLTNEYVEGKGWVSRGGGVKEPPRDEERKVTKGAPGRVKGGKDKISHIIKRPAKDPSPQESSAGSSDSESSSSATSSSATSSSGEDDDSETTSTISSSDNSSSSSSDEDESTGEEKLKELDITKYASALSSQPPGTPIAKPGPESKGGDEDTSNSVHPLEALFKLPGPATPKSAPRPSLEIQTQFSFFGEDNGDDGGDNDVDGTAGTGLEPPQTPFTRQDLQSRGIRSAAPTPDTAAPQRISFWENNDNNNHGYDDEYDDEHYQENETSNAKKLKKDDTQTKGKGKIPGSDGGNFASWFWENRGENNRAWKKRRREAAKEKRQRENRRRGNKGK